MIIIIIIMITSSRQAKARLGRSGLKTANPRLHPDDERILQVAISFRSSHQQCQKMQKKKPTSKFNFTLEKRWPVSKFSFWLSHRALIDSSWKLMKNYHYDQQYHFQKAGGRTATSFRSRRFNTVCRPFNLFLKIAEMRKKKSNFGWHYQW